MAYETPLSAEDNANSGERSGEFTLAPRPALVHVAFVFTLLYMAVHVYWAVGGTWGLPPSAPDNEATVKAANWVVSAIMLCGAFFVLALNHPISRRVPSWMVLVPIWCGAVVCVSHAFFGFFTKGLYLMGHHGAVDFPDLPGMSAAKAAAENHHAAVVDIAVFEPCFLIQGLVLALAAWQFVRTAPGRRRWAWSVAVGTVVIDVFGGLLALGGMHFAVS
jgi:Protein of unknown function (DUF3995)